MSECGIDFWIGCQAPNTLRRLDLIRIDDYSTVDLRKFHQIRTLCIRLGKFKDLQLPSDSFVSDHLSKMIINNEQKVTADIGILTQCTAINFNAITHLQLSQFGVFDVSQNVPCDLFARLIALFPEIQYLHLWRVYISPFDTPNLLIPALFPKLNIFVVNEIADTFAGQISDAMSHQLQALRSWNIEYEFDPSTDNISFPVLEELEFIGPCASPSTNRMIQSSSKTLKRVLVNCFNATNLDSMDARHSVGNLLRIAKHLKILLILMKMSNIASISDIIAKWIYGIAEDCEETRSGIQIILGVKCDITCRSDEIMYQSLKIVNELNASKFEDFMFMWSIWSQFEYQSHEPQQEDLDKEMTRAKRLYGDRFNISCGEKCIIITNKDCKISDRDKTLQPYFTSDWRSTTNWMY